MTPKCTRGCTDIHAATLCLISEKDNSTGIPSRKKVDPNYHPCLPKQWCRSQWSRLSGCFKLISYSDFIGTSAACLIISSGMLSWWKNAKVKDGNALFAASASMDQTQHQSFIATKDKSMLHLPRVIVWCPFIGWMAHQRCQCSEYIVRQLSIVHRPDLMATPAWSIASGKKQSVFATTLAAFCMSGDDSSSHADLTAWDGIFFTISSTLMLVSRVMLLLLHLDFGWWTGITSITRKAYIWPPREDCHRVVKYQQPIMLYVGKHRRFCEWSLAETSVAFPRRAYWLLIFDNADGSPRVVAKYMPTGNRGNILFTSRNPGVGGSNITRETSIKVEDMGEEDAISLLLKSAWLDESSPDMQKAASVVANTLCFFPLAIDQAGVAIRSGSVHYRQLSHNVLRTLAAADEPFILWRGIKLWSRVYANGICPLWQLKLWLLGLTP